MDLMKRRLMMLPTDEPYIRFADPYAEEFCVNSFGDGVGITKRMARKVKTSQFTTALANYADKTQVTSFDEFRYFNHVTEAGNWSGCTLLTSITLPKSCVNLNWSAFSGCTSLSSINLDNIMTMRGAAFKNCSSLQLVVDMPKLTNFNASVAINYESFSRSGITKVLNLGTIRDLGEYSAFAYCPNLTEVHVPKTVTRIGDLTFYQCPSLVTLILLPTNPPTLATTRAIGGATGRKIYVPYSSDHSILSAYKSAQNWSNFEDDIFELNQDGTVPDEV